MRSCGDHLPILLKAKPFDYRSRFICLLNTARDERGELKIQLYKHFCHLLRIVPRKSQVVKGSKDRLNVGSSEQK